MNLGVVHFALPTQATAVLNRPTATLTLVGLSHVCQNIRHHGYCPTHSIGTSMVHCTTADAPR